MKKHIAAAVGVGVAMIAASANRAVHAESLITAVGQEIALGNDLNDEPCRLRLVRTAPSENDRREFSVYCQGWTQPSGTVVSFSTGNSFNPQEFLTKGPVAESIEARLASCSPPAPAKIADELAGAVRFCRRPDGGWPVVVGATKANGRGYRFETLPTNTPLAERAVEALASDKGTAIKQGSRTALIQQYEAAAGAAATQVSIRDFGAAQGLRRLGEEQIYAGRNADAERTWRTLADITQRLFGPQFPGLGKPLTEWSLAVLRQGRVTEADALQHRAEPLVQKAADADDYPEWLSYRSYLEHRLQHDDVALALAKQALDKRREIAQRTTVRGQVSRRSSIALGHSAIVLAREYNGVGRFKDAAAPAEEAVQNYGRGYGEIHPMIAWSYQEEATANFGAGDLPKARVAIDKALAMHELLYGESEPVFLDAVISGRIAVKEQHPADAQRAFDRAIKIAEGSSSIQVRPSAWLADDLDLTAAGPGGAAASFQVAQLVRGGITDEAIRAMAARIAADDPSVAGAVRALQDAQAHRVDLRTQLVIEARKKPEEREPGEEERIKGELAQAEAESAATEQRLQAQFPRYARLTQPSRVPADAIGKLLRPDEALLLAVSVPSATYVFLLRNGKVQLNKAPVTLDMLTKQISAVRKTLDASDTGLLPFDVDTAHQLYQTLLGPLAKDLAGLRHLVFVSNGPLLSLPLGVLVRETGATPAYLARDVAISVVPTVGAFRDLRQAAASKAAQKAFLGFGDPDFTGAAGDLRGLRALDQRCRADKAIDAAEFRQLPRLPETAAELKGIAASLKAPPDSIVLGAAATKASLRGRNLEQYRVIAFATHGLLANELDCQNEPALALSLPPNAASGADGLLDVSAIVGLRLNADWILLSACNTAGPGGLAGEALSGLTRAFFYAGARSVMATHWPVESTATVRLTTTTFESFAKDPKRGKAAALREAQLALMNDKATAHPIFWAPFVLVGDGG